MKETPSQKNLFTGSLDLDNEARSVKDNDYIDALNIRNSISRDGKDKQVTKMRGNELVPFVQPQTPIPSSNKCIGSFENLANRLNYSFIYNSQGAMQIRENNIDNGTVTSVVDYNFGWQDDKFISNVDLVDNKLLLWTDTKPRRINIEKSREDKNFKGNIYFASADPNFATQGSNIIISVLDKNGNIVSDPNTGLAIASYTVQTDRTRRELAKDITDFINGIPALSEFCTATTCKEYVEIEFTRQGYFRLGVGVFSSLLKAIYVPQNYYFSINETIIDAGKYPLNCPPRLQIKQDDKRAGFNNIERTTWQFATQVIYDDFDESTLSPYSDIAFINCEQRGNYIEVDFTDTRLNDPVDLSIISKIRVLARPSNQGKFREIAVIEQQDLWLNSGAIGINTIRFYNDGQYTIIDDATATLPYSALPIEIVGDKYDMGEENFDNRVGYSKFIENYEAPCITAELTPTFIENTDKNFTIGGNILIYNPNQFNLNNGLGAPGYIGAIHQPEENKPPVFGGANSMAVNTDTGSIGGQYLMSGGFPVYLAGTDYLAISEQNRLPTGQYGSNNVFDTTTQAGRDSLRQIYVEYNSTSGASGFPLSTFQLKNVQAGRYVLCVASHLCSFGGIDYGSNYDLNSSAYQKTSTFFRGVDVFNGTTFLGEQICKEISIDVRDNGQYTIFINSVAVFVGNASPTNEIFIGNINIEDIASRIVREVGINPSTSFRTVASLSGYLVDAEGSSLIQDVAKGVAMERQLVQIQTQTRRQPFDKITGLPINPPIIDTDTVSVPTDRNGFYYSSGQRFYKTPAIPLPIGIEQRVRYAYRIFALSVTAGTANPIVIRTQFDDYFYSSNNQILFDVQTGSAQKGIFTFEYVDTPVPVPAFGIVAYSTNQNVSQNCRTIITGRVVNDNGVGVSDILVSFENTNRVEKTQADGTFSILVYGDYFSSGQNSRANFIVLSSCCDCRVIFTASGIDLFVAFLTLTPFGAAGLNINNPFAPLILNDIVCNVVGAFIRHLKSGGKYIFALFHVDELNRRHALVTNNLEVSIPFLTEQRQDYFQNVGTGNSNGVFEFTLNVTTPPPTWADKLYVARTQDTYYSDFLQFPLYDAKYVVQYDDENSLPIETTFSTFSANEIYLGFPQSTIAYKEFNSASQKGWDFQEGDRVRFISKPNGELYSELYDLPIKAQRTDSTNEFIYFAIDNLDALGEVTQGTLVEVYRPKKDLDDNVELFFEIHQCIDIVEVNGQKQYVGLPKKLSTGDTYSRNRTVPISNGISSNFIEDNSISDNWQSRQQDIGRVVVKDSRFGRLVRENAIKFSNQYIPGSKLNGLSRFEPLNEFEYPRQYGAINKLIMVNDNADIQVLLVACENNTFVIYIKEVIYNDVRGAETVSVADRVLGSFRTLKGDYGTKNPESFAFRDGQIFWWDENRGAFVRYDNNGMDDLVQLNINQYSLDINVGTSVISAYDDFYSEFITIPLQDNKQAIGFLSDKRGWNSKYSFKPEMLGTSGEWVLSWKNGELWVHDSPNVPYCNFYGQQFTSKITFVSKLSPLGLKVAQNLRVKASDVWEAVSIQTVPNAMYKQGMMSRLKKGNWKNFEGDFWATVLRNMNDPRFTDPNVALLRGEPLRGDAFIIELQNDSTDVQSLRMAEMYYFSSENTNG